MRNEATRLERRIYREFGKAISAPGRHTPELLDRLENYLRTYEGLTGRQPSLARVANYSRR